MSWRESRKRGWALGEVGEPLEEFRGLTYVEQMSLAVVGRRDCWGQKQALGDKSGDS